MKRRGTLLKDSIIWFNNLIEEKRCFIVDCLKNNYSVRLSNYLLDENDLKQYLALIDQIVELVVMATEREIVIKKLKLAGMEEINASLFYDFSESFVIQRQDAKVVQNLTPEVIKNCTMFIIEKMFLSREFSLYSPDYVARKCGFHNTDEMFKTIRFLYKRIHLIVNRDYSLPTIRSVFQIECSIPDELCEVFFDILQENLPQLYQSQMIMRMNSFQGKIDYITDFIDKINLDESEQIDEEEE